MKAMKLLTISILAGLLFIGCAQESSSPGVPGTDISVDGSPVSDGSDTSSSSAGGNIVDLEIMGSDPADKVNKMAVFEGSTLNNPTNIQMTVSLVNRGTGNYGGKIKISWKDGDWTYNTEVKNGETSQYLKHHDVQEVAGYNKWFQKNGKWYFHGFFEDSRGAVILVIDGFDDVFYGDGQVPTSYKGSVWYKNFSTQIIYNPWAAPHGDYHCWFISEGPYDCRAWPSGDDVNTFASIYPDNGYIKLAEFTGLDIEDAFK